MSASSGFAGLSEVMGLGGAESMCMEEFAIGAPFGVTESFDLSWRPPMDLELLLEIRDPRRRSGLPDCPPHVSTVTSVPIGVYGKISAEAASGSSTQPRLCGEPNEERLKLCSASPPLK
jgi:hypothetical protein